MSRPGASFIALTPGDPEGIGFEIAVKAWRDYPSFLREPKRAPELLFIGAQAPFEKLGVPLAIAREPLEGPPRARRRSLWLLPAPAQAPGRRHLAGYQCGWSIETATRMTLLGQAAALVTGPISKERLQRGGYPFPGHTEFIAKLCGDLPVTMMLANSQLRVSLVTTHLSLADVPGQLRGAEIRRAVIHTVESLRTWWGIRRPRVAVAALNPHAGEGGLFGTEEIEIIRPALAGLRRILKAKAEILGPLPADTLFAKHLEGNPAYDAVVCMYHDQGLIPVKLLDFRNTVNVTLGLPMIRTSVDHGVGFDIAGKGIADPSSLKAAIQMAVDLSARQIKLKGKPRV